MGVRDKLLDFKRRLSDRHMYSVVLIVTAIIASIAIYQYKRALDYRGYVENQYNRAFHELVNYVEDLDVSLSKLMLVNTPAKISDISSEIWREAAFAQANLGQLPVSDAKLDKTSKFLTQVGDYCYSLSRKTMDEKPVSDKEYETLENLHKYSLTLSKTLNEMEEAVYSGRLKFGELSKQGSKYFTSAAKKMSTNKVENIQKDFQDYPTLIYDGPFSDHIERISARMLENGKEITIEQAKQAAIKILGQNKAKDIEHIGGSNGNIKTYSFVAYPDGKENDRKVTIDITKKNGYALWMLDNRNVTNANLDIDKAKQKAKEFLKKNGIVNVKESYYLKGNGVATVNYAYVQDNIVMYPDLIKVKVALDTGEIVGFEAKGYIMSHQDTRQLPPVNISEDEAKAKINSRLQIKETRFAVIPLESRREVMCYEFMGTFGKRNFLIYINAETGKEEKILILLETPNGILTM